jgi:hypothetical protein
MAEQEIVFIAFPGAPYVSASIERAEEWAERLLENHDDLVHVTIVSVPKDWAKNYALVVENRGIMGTVPGQTARPYRVYGTPED